jgi:FlaG/FlaF family flagellin (archaellin)
MLMCSLNAISPEGGDSRGVTPAMAVGFLVVITVVLSIVTMTGLFFMSDEVNESPPQAIIEVEYNSDGTATIAHRGGEAIPGESVRVTGPVAEQNPFEDEMFTAGDRATVELVDSGSATVVWQSDDSDTSTVLERLETSAQGNWTVLRMELENNSDITLQNDYTPNSPNYNKEVGSGSWVPIDYNGVLDGNGHELRGIVVDNTGCFGSGFICSLGLGGEVTNLNVNDVEITGDDRTGFIGVIDGTVRNVHLENVDIEGKDRVGALVGQNQYSVVENSSVDGGTVTGDRDVGGLVGKNLGATRGSSANVTVEADSFVAGGLVGFNPSGEIADSYATGDVVSAGNYAGGLAGRNEHYINNSYATGNVTGKDGIGGLVGGQSASRSNEAAVIRDSYATGTVSGTDKVGALVGEMGTGFGPGIIRDSYATSPVSGDSNVGGLVGLLSDGTVDNSEYRP